MLCWGISWSILVINVFSRYTHNLPKGSFVYSESTSDALDILWYSTWMHCIMSMSWRGCCLYWKHMNMWMLGKESCYSWGSFNAGLWSEFIFALCCITTLVHVLWFLYNDVFSLQVLLFHFSHFGTFISIQKFFWW